MSLSSEPRYFIFAHGAGADSRSEFMTCMQDMINCQEIEVITFDFPYMIKRQQTGKQSPPNRMPILIESFKEEINKLSANSRVFIGGKSMGGRVASMIADEVNAAGLICLGYPFHPTGKPENLRTGHLETLTTRTLIVQGTRDTFGKPDEVATYSLSNAIETFWIEDGNHSLETLKRSQLTTLQSWQLAAEKIQQFILAE